MIKPCHDIRVKTFGPPAVDRPLVSVMMITYNHEPYIRQAIESVFAQDFDGPMELVIGEDCSTDNTRAIIEDVCRNAPIHVRLLTSERNVGMHANTARTLADCCGKYLALLEGDDAWCDSTKIAGQVKFLERNPRIIGCAHKAELVFASDVSDAQRSMWPHSVIPDLSPGLIPIERLLTFSFLVPTASLVVRAEQFRTRPRWLDELPFGDWYLVLQTALLGGLHFEDRVMSRYRIVPNGATAAMSYEVIKAGQIRLLEGLLENSDPAVTQTLLDALQRSTYSLCDALERAERGSEVVLWLERLEAVERKHQGARSRRTARWLFKYQHPHAGRVIRAIRRRLGPFLRSDR